MERKLSKRMELFSSSVFSEIAHYKQELRKQGKDIIDLSIGSPDMPPPAYLKQTLSELCLDDSMYGYTMKGTAEFHNAVASYYRRNHDVVLDPASETMQLMGSQDGLVHLPMAFADPGDIVLVPDPGYTAYAAGIAMAGASPYYMPLLKENGFLPHFPSIPAEIADKAAMMILNFPGNPIPTMASEAFFQEAIGFAKKHNILIVHDFAYSELYYGDCRPVSFLSVDGGKEIGIEMNSLSKSFNLAGCRVAYAAGNEQMLNALQMLKSNLDYGVFHPIQTTAAKALLEGDSFSEENRSLYRKRRDALVVGLNEIGWDIPLPDAGMFVWAPIPCTFTSKEFTYKLMNEAGVAVTPGSAFGPSGEGYIRIALVQDEASLHAAVERITKSHHALHL